MRPNSLTLMLPVIALCAAGCTARVPRQAALPEPPRCSSVLKLDAVATLEFDAARPLEHRFDDRSRCLVELGGVSSTYAVFRLPRYRDPWALSVDSLIDGAQLFAPEVATLDAKGRVRRTLPFDRFSPRGDRLQATVFFNETDSEERYLLLRSAPSAVGRNEKQVVSNALVIPLLNTVLPIIYMQGVEREREVTLSRTGIVNLQARSGSAMRRQFDADGAARSELGKFVR
ncbi:MAG: MalM family protein [Panacagrimonas sp.]